ncbi:PQQ-binding-like beta-propeller repeat protein [Streptomyces sp. NPDC007264]|uniref:serine/threonine-protein kinase n=1 Tax=Streptomyces sp. NPDC007264 TaxID=3364777 RepID=UPI0036D779CF
MSLRDSDPAEVGGYRIEDRLGSGGMGVVYLARSASGRRLAVKVVHGQYADDDEFRIRFRREVAAARRVSGAFTAPVVDADADASRPWMATLYIPGENLGTHVRRHGPLPLPRLRELAAGLAEALRDIHRAGVVHRDLKPANVMLADDGPRVIDFGISRAAEFASADVLTQTGRVMGTPPFMSPEQFSAPQEVGPAADIFSLGAVVAYAATGRGPFDSPSPYETATRVVEGSPQLDGIPDELRTFVELCLEKHPKVRPTPDELLAFLRDGTRPDPRRAAEQQGMPTMPALPEGGERPEDPDPAERPRRGRRRIVIGAVATVLALAATAVVALTQTSEHPGDRTGLPAGWRPWHATAKGAQGADAPFNRCALVGTSLVCAGDDLEAVSFSQATGRQMWSRPVDSTKDDTAGSDGSILGVRGGAVYVYANDAEERDTGSTQHYSIRLLDATTARVLWTTRTGDGDAPSAPDPDQGGSAVVPEGVLTLMGTEGNEYGLLDAGNGAVRWRHRLPVDHSCTVAAAGGRPYLRCESSGGTTRVSQIDPATGTTRWSVKAGGSLSLLGQAHGRLVLAGPDSDTAYRTITTVDTVTHRLIRVPLTRPQPASAVVRLTGGTLYFALTNGSIRSIDPRTGRQNWAGDSGVELPGPPVASAARVYVASPTGRLAALDRRTGKVEGSRAGRSDGGDSYTATQGAAVLLTGNALYVPYGARSVYSVDARHL